MGTSENKKVAQQAFEALARDNLELLRDLLAPDAVVHQCGFLHPISGQAVLEGQFPGQRRVRDREVRLVRIVGEDDIVALHWRTSGWYYESDSAEAHGTDVSFPSMTFLRFDRGKIAEIWNIQDTATLRTQLDAAGRV